MKGIDYVIKKTAGQLNLPEAEVKVVVMKYWDTIYKRLLKLEKTTITARHLGSFTISRYKLNNFISKLIRSIKTLPDTPMSEETRENIYKIRIARLKTACQRRNEIAIMFKESKEARILLRKTKKLMK